MQRLQPSLMVLYILQTVGPAFRASANLSHKSGRISSWVNSVIARGLMGLGAQFLVYVPFQRGIRLCGHVDIKLEKNISWQLPTKGVHISGQVKHVENSLHTHTHTQVHVPTQVHSSTHCNTHTVPDTHTHSHLLTIRLAHTNAYTLISLHTHTPSHANTRAHTNAFQHTLSHTNTHTH